MYDVLSIGSRVSNNSICFDINECLKEYSFENNEEVAPLKKLWLEEKELVQTAFDAFMKSDETDITKTRKLKIAWLKEIDNYNVAADNYCQKLQNVLNNWVAFQ